MNNLTENIAFVVLFYLIVNGVLAADMILNIRRDIHEFGLHGYQHSCPITRNEKGSCDYPWVAFWMYLTLLYPLVVWKCRKEKSS